MKIETVEDKLVILFKGLGLYEVLKVEVSEHGVLINGAGPLTVEQVLRFLESDVPVELKMQRVEHLYQLAYDYLRDKLHL
jgi:hypothetical protein